MKYMKVVKKFGKGLIGGGLVGGATAGLTGQTSASALALITALTALLAAGSNFIKHWKKKK